MQITYCKSFTKQYAKKDSFIKEKFVERQRTFVVNKFEPILNNHPLTGKYLGCRSINVTGDVRAIFEEISNTHVEFIAIGTHPELYG